MITNIQKKWIKSSIGDDKEGFLTWVKDIQSLCPKSGMFGVAFKELIEYVESI